MKWLTDAFYHDVEDGLRFRWAVHCRQMVPQADQQGKGNQKLDRRCQPETVANPRLILAQC
jgi:hypothetical protein